MTGRAESAYIIIVNYLTAKNIPILALLLSGGLLCGAWFFQYVLGYPPCQMCYWQRHAHKAVLAIAVLALLAGILGKQNPRLFAVLIGLSLVVSFGLAFWHVGVEYKWWEGPQTCSAPAGTIKLDDFDINKMNDAKPPSCADAVWHFLGLSMAGWNALISGIGAVFSFLGAKRP